MKRTLCTLVLLLCSCGNLPDSYSLACETDAGCLDGLECLELSYALDTGSYGEFICTMTCQIDEDCPRSWTAHCGTEQLECVEGVCGSFQCK